MAETLVTLVVASYNHADYIPQCLQSVADQTLLDFDLIVTDDASTDQSQHVIREQLEALSLEARLIFHADNQGICATFNEALEQVNTPFVAFLAADDWMAPERLEEQAGALLAAPKTTALVYGDLWLADAAGKAMGLVSDRTPEAWGFGISDDLFSRLLRHNWISAPSVMSKADALRNVGGFDSSLPYEDYDMWLRLARRYDFAFLRKPLVCYRIHDDSLHRDLVGAGARKYHLSKLKIVTKHLGISLQTDEIVREEAYRHAVNAYRSGAEPSEVRTHIRSHRAAMRSPRGLAYAALTSLNIRVSGARSIAGFLRWSRPSQAMRHARSFGARRER